MNTVPPTDNFEFAGNSAQNQAALEELTSAIAFGQGADTITLLLARCNYGRLRDQMVEQLGQRLAGEDLQGPVQVLQLGTDDYNLYAQLQMMQRGDSPPGAVLVLGMERLGSLEVFLVELNKRREEFRREFPFPLVLWFTDQGYRLLSKHANDFESIAGGETIEFTLSIEALTHGLQLASDHLFETLLAPDIPASFNKQLRQLNAFGYLQPHELSLALTALQAQGIALEPDLQASVAFARGLDVPNQVAIELFQQSANYWRTQADKQLRYGLSLFYLGRARYYVVDSTKYRSADWEGVVPPLQDSLAVFEQAERPDLMAKCINQLERVLHRLERWDELEATAQQALALHQRYSGTSKQAQDYGFLADVALHRQQWQRGAELAQTALDTLKKQDSWWRLLYLKMLAEAKHRLGERATAIAHLQAAQALGVMEHPTLYSGILLGLQQCLREQGDYLRAFKIKRERLAIEKQYGLRAFIGAGRLRSQRIEQRMTVRSERETLEEIAPEIEASGRKRDLTELLNRIAGKTHKLVVVHGTSGVGKSSLINGGLLPALRGRTLENRKNVPVLVRKYTDWQQELVKALEGLKLLGGDLDGGADGEEVSSVGGPLNPPSLGDFEMRVESKILDVLRICEDRTLRPVLLFDQFEEFFFANPDPLRRRVFFEFVARCLDLPGALKIVFSIREDYLHYLLEARQLVKQNQLEPGSMARAQLEDILGKQILYEIGNFSPEDTKSIIENLASGSRMYLEPELVDALVRDLAGPLREVRPIEMQVVGAQLQTNGIQTLGEYRQLGAQPKETLVQRYLDDVVEDCGEENQRLASLVLFLLTDERGTRPLKTGPELVRELEALGVRLEAEVEVQGLDLVLRVLTGSGIVVYLPDTPDDRYQLVHDYLAGVIRASQAPQLEKLVAELEEEKRKRLLLESEKADLEAANAKARQELGLIQDERENLRARNRQARRGLTGTIAAAAAVAFVTVGVAIAATKNADRSTLDAGLTTWKANRQEIWANLKQRKAGFDVEVAEFRQNIASRRAQAADKKVKKAEKSVEEANTRLKEIDRRTKAEQQEAQAAIESAQAKVTEAEIASQQAERDLEVARLAEVAALEERESARLEATLVRRVTNLERAGVNASRKFEAQQSESLFVAFKLSKEANDIIKANGINYLAASPLLALQTGLNNVRETQLTGHQGHVSGCR